MTITEKTNGLVEISTDEQHILHRKDTPDKFPEIRHVTIHSNMLPLYEEVSADRPALHKAIADKIAEIDRYDKSHAVDGFTLDGKEMWFDADMRGKIRTGVDSRTRRGHDTYDIFWENVAYTFPVKEASVMLDILEDYAIETLSVTSRHRAAVCALEDIEAVKAYDHTAGYPPKPQF